MPVLCTWIEMWRGGLLVSGVMVMARRIWLVMWFGVYELSRAVEGYPVQVPWVGER